MQKEQDTDNTHRKKLTKRAPTFDTHLRRSPSLPSNSRARSNSNQTAQSQKSHTRSPTLPDTASQRSINSYIHQDSPGGAVGSYPNESRFSVSKKTSTDLLGQRFDAAAILHNLNAVSYNHEPQQAQHHPSPQSIQHTSSWPSQPHHSRGSGSSATLANQGVRLSESLAATGRRMEDITSPHGDLSSRNPRHLPDEGKESKLLKKKSGFSSFMNNLVGTPRRPAISAPENPVHVTHVGYDQETGEFTVCSDTEITSSLKHDFADIDVLRACRRNGKRRFKQTASPSKSRRRIRKPFSTLSIFSTKPMEPTMMI